MITLSVDFNEIAGDADELVADLPAQPLSAGQEVFARDENGNSMRAVVEEIDLAAALAYLRLLEPRPWSFGDTSPETIVFSFTPRRPFCAWEPKQEPSSILIRTSFVPDEAFKVPA